MGIIIPFGILYKYTKTVAFSSKLKFQFKKNSSKIREIYCEDPICDKSHSYVDETWNIALIKFRVQDEIGKLQSARDSAYDIKRNIY